MNTFIVCYFAGKVTDLARLEYRMNTYSVGLLLLTRPFEVWLAAYMLFQVIERKNLLGWINYILLGMNAFATIVAVYGLIIGKSDNILGNVFGQGLGAVLLGSSIAIWVIWIFIIIYGNLSNNMRGITISLSKYKKVDGIMLFFVVPASMLLCMIEIVTVFAGKLGELFKNSETTILFFGSIIIIGLNIWYLVSLKNRLKNYVVFGRREIELWNGQRQKIYKYANISGVEQLEIKTHFSCKYRINLQKDGVEETIVVDDERIETVLEELLKTNNKMKKRNGGNGHGQDNT